MALVDSLLSAMIRAGGDALVMHVGERPYVVTQAGTLDLSTHGLNLSAMTGMLQQLLPADAMVSLDEFGAVEHRLPSVGEDRFTVVAARGGDDIWIEIRRRRREAAPAAVTPAAPAVAAPSVSEPQSVVLAEPDEAAVVSEATLTADMLPATEQAREAEPRPAESLEPDVLLVELPAAMQADVPVEPLIEPLFETTVETLVEATIEELPMARPILEVETPVEQPAAQEAEDVFEIAAVDETGAALAAELAAELSIDAHADTAPAPDPVPAVAAPMAAPILELEIPADDALVSAVEFRVEEAAEDVYEIAAADETGAALAAELAAELSIDVHADTAPAPDPVPAVAAPMAAPILEPEIPVDDVPVSAVEFRVEEAAEDVYEIAAEDATGAPLAAEFSIDARADTAPAPDPVPAVAAPMSSSGFAETAQASREPTGPTLVVPMTRTVRIELPPRAMPHSRASTVDRLLRLASARGASALFLMSESRPHVRVEGDIRAIDTEPSLSKANIDAALMDIVPEDLQDSVSRGEATEWIAELPELGRIRCTSFRDHRGPGILFSMIATRAATAEQLGLAREVEALATEAQGLVLVAGPRGCGKSTLISALVDLVNRQRAEYVITLERQIRLIHDNRAALVSQREIRGGADDAVAAARSALRENPDVLVVDDLNSAQMVPLLLDAAADGLLVFVSITAPSTVDAVQRLIDLVPVETRASTQTAMAETFRGAVSQVLLKKSGGGRVAAREVLLATAPVTRLIGDGQLSQLPLALETGRRHGMVPLTDVLVALVQAGVVDAREAFRKTHDRERLLAGLKREGVDTSVVDRLA